MNKYLLALNTAAVVTVAMAGGGGTVQADTFSCHDGDSCPFEATCTDDLYRWTSLCAIQCEHLVGGGQTSDTGSATCASS